MPQNKASQPSKSSEFKAFLFIVIILFPLLSIVLVGSYGFTIWVSQMVFGPPSV